MTAQALEASAPIDGASAAPPIRLVGGRIALDAQSSCRGEITIAHGRIRSVPTDDGNSGFESGRLPSEPVSVVDLSGYLILPGLINAHDHLEFNLFPRLGSGPYPNFERWAEDIYHPERSPVREQLMVLKPVRLWWGGIKNLLSGATTVCHHNPFNPEIFTQAFPVRVVRRYGWAHSLRLSTNLVGAFRSTPSDAPFIVHLAESSAPRSPDEACQLDRLGLLGPRTVGVHAVGLSQGGRELVQRRGAALVWCPTSNLFTLGKTLDPSTVLQNPRIALGSDSALTAQGDLLDEISAAHRITNMTSKKIFDLVTTRAADVLRLREGEGTIRPGAVADLIALPDRTRPPADALAAADFKKIEMVMVGGRPALLSPKILDRWPKGSRTDLCSLCVGGVERLVRAPVPWLIGETKNWLGSDFRLAGRKVGA